MKTCIPPVKKLGPYIDPSKKPGHANQSNHLHLTMPGYGSVRRAMPRYGSVRKGVPEAILLLYQPFHDVTTRSSIVRSCVRPNHQTCFC